jgi:hypothetical protein
MDGRQNKTARKQNNALLRQNEKADGLNTLMTRVRVHGNIEQKT